MTSRFALLGLPESLVLDSGEIDRAWSEAARDAHPDSTGESERGDPAAGINEARAILSDPAARLEHWLELRSPGSEPQRSAGVDEALMDLFSEIQPVLAQADEILAAHRRATTALAKALLAKSAVAAQLAVQGALGRVRTLAEERVAAFPRFEEEAGAGSFDAARRALAQLKFLRKWERQCQERLLGLIEC